MTEQLYASDPFATSRAFSPPPPPPTPGPTLFDALRRYPMLVLLPLVVLAAAGVTYGVKRAPVYTASSEVNVGAPNSDSQSTPGYVLAAQELASTYSREVTSQVITDPLSRATRMSIAQVTSRLSSPAIPDSTSFYVDATGPSAAAAIGLTNRATRLLLSKVNSGLQSQSASELLVRYNQLQSEANDLSSDAGKLQAKRDLQTAGTSSAALGTTPPVRRPVVTAAQVATAKLAAQTAQLKAQTAAQRYSTAAANGPSANLVILQSPRTATNDRATVTERYGIVGALAGLVIGVALAFLLARLRVRRAASRL